MQKLRKAVSAALLILLVFTLLPFSAFATEHLSAEQDPNLVVEEESLREEYVKHFRDPNGTHVAVLYTAPVHRKSSDGSWEDLDNRMTEKAIKNKQAYITSDGRTTFSKKLNADDPSVFSISENGYTISVSFISNDIKNSTAKLSNHAKKYVPTSGDSIDEQFKKLKSIDTTSTITYKNVLKKVNLEYVLSSNNIKENIVITEAGTATSFTFLYELTGLSARLTESGGITLIDSVSNEERYRIPTPYMYDANGETSYSVFYTLTDLGNGTYELTVTADEAWVNDEARTFPIVIDPTIQQSGGISDTYISSSTPNTNYGSADELLVNPTNIAYLKFDELPELPAKATIQSSNLHVTYVYSGLVLNMRIGVYQVLQEWDADVLTWTSASQYTNMGISTTATDSKTIPITPGFPSGTLTYDVTELTKAFYEGTSNYGFALKYLSATNPSLYIYAKESGGTVTPAYEITYTIDTTLLDDGTYFLQNIRNDSDDLYLQLDSNASNDYSTGVTCEVGALDGESIQKWDIEYLHTGYYKIISDHSNKALSIPSASVDTLNASLDQEFYNALYRQQWQFMPLTNGAFQISPRSNPTYSINGGTPTVTQGSYTASSTFDWNPIRMLPTNGYELDFDEQKDRWLNSAPPEEIYYNCYAYAINNQCDLNGNCVFEQIPGLYNSQNSSNAIFYSASDIILAAQTDFRAYYSVNDTKDVFYTIGKYDYCKEETYKVALFISYNEENGLGFHWCRQDSNGLWSHRTQSDQSPDQKDDLNDFIIDPEVATIHGFIFAGFFGVKPWNNYYNTTQTTSINFFETSSNEISDTPQSETITLYLPPEKEDNYEEE